MTTKQPVRPGLSAPIVTSIPNTWSAAWFRSFITNYLQNLDLKNATSTGGVTVSGNGTQPPTIALSPIAADSVLGNPNSSAATPTPLNQAQLTNLANTFTATSKGLVPSPGSVRGFFLRDDGSWDAIVIPTSTASSQIEVLYNEITLEDQWPQVIPSNLGPMTFNGLVTINAASNTAAMQVNGADIALAAFNSFAATNRAGTNFSQGGTTFFRVGVDGSQGFISDSVNGDGCVSVIRGGTLRFSTSPTATTTPTQMSLTQSGALTLKTSPLISTVTQVHSGLANFKSTLSTSANATLTADAALTVTCNETGWYDVEAFLNFYEATAGTGGFQFDFNGGAATIANPVFAVYGFSTAAFSNAAITSISTATGIGTVGTSSATPSWVRVKGAIQVTAAGTFGIRWAQNTILAIDPTTLAAGSSIILTKIG